MTLREGGIYRLPNGRELVVVRRSSRRGEEFHLGGWGCFELSEYVVNDAGRLTTDGQLTAWDVQDLKDTGRNGFGSDM